MKKIFALALAVLMLFALVACNNGGTTPPTNPQTPPDDGKKPVLRVAMECAYAPFNWEQANDANGAVPIKDSSAYANGYDVQMAKFIAEDMGYDLEIARIEWDSLIMAVQAGTVDCTIAGQSATEDRKKEVDFSDPYYYAEIVTLVREDNQFANVSGISGFSGATATAQLGTIWYDLCLPQIPEINLIPATESVPSMLIALDTKRVDIVVTDLPTAKAALIAYPHFKILNFTGTDDHYDLQPGDVEIGVAVKKGNTELIDKINAALAKLTRDDYDKRMDEAITNQPLSQE